ncbi:MAG: hypothetical protein AAGD96_22200 [Chloroflexota bacterium]
MTLLKQVSVVRKSVLCVLLVSILALGTSASPQQLDKEEPVKDVS